MVYLASQSTLIIKMLCIFRPELFTSYFLTIHLSCRSYSRQYEKLSDIVIRLCKNITESGKASECGTNFSRSITGSYNDVFFAFCFVVVFLFLGYNIHYLSRNVAIILQCIFVQYNYHTGISRCRYSILKCIHNASIK